MARRRNKCGRNISGIILLDKPVGMTSNGSLQHVKRLFNANKAGHTGSLDAPATGLLPICLGEATKISAYLLDADKTYLARCKLGEITTTADATGEVIARTKIPMMTPVIITNVFNNFIGEIEQVPPMYSALKQQGKRLYELAYQGLEVERKPRKITIRKIELIDLKQDEFEMKVTCSKGTYIRTLAEDIGKALDSGAHILSLRRIAVGPFKEEQMITAEKLQHVAESGFSQLDELLLPLDTSLDHLPKVYLSNLLSNCFKQGQMVTTATPKSGRVRIYDEQRTFIGIGEVAKASNILPKRLINKD